MDLEQAIKDKSLEKLDLYLAIQKRNLKELHYIEECKKIQEDNYEALIEDEKQDQNVLLQQK